MLRRPRVIRLLLCATATAAVAAPSAFAAQTGGAEYKDASSSSQSGGGTGYGAKYSTPNKPVVAGGRAVLRNGVAYAPANAPAEVQAAIWAGNRLQKKPYRRGGGHQRINDSGYDCSGTVSYVLHAAGLLKTPLDSGSFMKWGVAGVGEWITVYTNPGHAYVLLAGLRLDTSTGGGGEPRTGSGPRWRRNARSAANGPFTARHPAGF